MIALTESVPTAWIRFIGAMLLGSSVTVYACSISSDVDTTPPSIGERTSKSEYVIVGSNISETRALDHKEVPIFVEQWLKGTGPASIVVTFGDFSCDVSPPNSRSIIFLNFNDETQRFEIADYFLFGGVAEVSELNIEDVLSTIKYGLNEHLRRKSAKYRMVGHIEAGEQDFALIEVPSGEVYRVQEGGGIVGTNIRILKVTEAGTRLEIGKTAAGDSIIIDLVP